MERIEIKTQLEVKAYQKLILQLAYKRPYILYMTLLGIMAFIYGLLSLIGILEVTNEPYIQALVFGSILCIQPYAILRGAKKNFQSNARLSETIGYSFTPEEVKIIGDSFQSVLTWEKTYKVRELKTWIMIYQSKEIANLIPKAAFTDEQLATFKGWIKAVPNLESKLL